MHGRVLTGESIAEALASDEMTLYFQPVFDVADRHIVAVEALLRWERSADDTATARELMPRAMAAGLLRTIDLTLLESACAFTRELQRSGASNVRLVVNVAAQELEPGMGLVGALRRALNESRLMPQWLQVQVSEAALRGRVQDYADTFDALAQLGVGVSIDDFWGGDESEELLLTSHARHVTIDVRANTGSPAAVEALRHAAVLAANRGLSVTAKRIESVDEMAFAESVEGVDSIQGYQVGRPLSQDQFRNRLASMLRNQPRLSDEAAAFGLGAGATL
jgi:EAL domain-containing protein (putative c-di-GMP-specific phosphodiesterase class I)